MILCVNIINPNDEHFAGSNNPVLIYKSTLIQICQGMILHKLHKHTSYDH